MGYKLRESTFEDFMRATENRSVAPEVQSVWWNSLFKQCAYCVGSVGGGGLAAHIGCIAVQGTSILAPAATATATSILAPAATATATSILAPAVGHNPFLMIGGGLLSGMAALGTWFLRSGQYSSTRKQVTTIGFALAGLALTTGINLHNHEHSHNRAEAEAWFAAQPPEAQKNITEVAAAWHLSVDDYLIKFKICSPLPRPTGKTTQQSTPENHPPLR